MYCVLFRYVGLPVAEIYGLRQFDVVGSNAINALWLASMSVMTVMSREVNIINPSNINKASFPLLYIM